VLDVDQQQYALGDGPCLDAVRRRVVNRVRENDAAQRWPAFVEHARGCGVRSFLAAPLVAGGRGVGALNLYGAGPDSFGTLDDALVSQLSGQASVALANAQLYRRATAVSEQLTEAMASRPVIDQAKGVLMARLGLTPDEAFLELRARSQKANRKLRDVAVDVVQDVRCAP
jgi:GAF domain-containing protein